MPGRSSHGDKYRYGFNGQEKSTELDQHGNSMTAEFWQYDARLGRRWNVDPVVKEHESPYAAFSNNPLINIDVKGDSDSSVVPDKSQALKQRLESLVKQSKKYTEKEQEMTQTLLDTYNEAISEIGKARKKGYDESANHLQLYLNGDGETHTESLDYLGTYLPFRLADRRLNLYYLSDAQKRLGEVAEGGSLSYISDKRYFAKVGANLLTDLYYASGTSFITAKTVVKISKSKDSYTISLTIFKSWGDTYDWHKGLGASGFRYFSNLQDANLADLEGFGAKKFEMRAYYITNYSVTYSLGFAGTYKINVNKTDTQTEKKRASSKYYYKSRV